MVTLVERTRTRELSAAPSVSVSVSASAERSLPGSVEVARPESVLGRAEIEQSRRTAISGLIFNTVGLLLVPFVGGDPLAVWCFAIGLVAAELNNAWLLYVSSSPARYRESAVIAYFALAALPNLGILFYLGTFGPLLVMFVFNVYSTCLGYDRRVARVTLVGAIAPPVILGTAIAGGWIEDPGLVTTSPLLGSWGQVVVVVAFVLFLVLTYQQGCKGRELVVASLVERDAAIRSASHREALFLEARQDLERALQAGGMGRFSEQTLGSFKLGAVLGRGGMGEVYEAVHVETGEPAAVKLLLPEVLGRTTFVRRFLREVKIASSLQSPHVVRVLEVGDESAPIPFLAMERLVGEDLARILRRDERLSPKAVLRMVRHVGRGIEAAVEAGIVHRDLKPQNLFLTEDHTWKILDFGISKATGDDTLTQGETIGTPGYMAPEQARGRPVDVRTDLYALGTIAYRALTGRRAFPGEDGAAVLVDVLEKMPVRPSAYVELPSAVDDVLALALAKSPADRFATPAAFTEALTAAISGTLDPTLRKRARTLTAKHPWRHRID